MVSTVNAWDFAGEYSGTSNPNDIWTYGMLNWATGPVFVVYDNNHTLTAAGGEVVQFWTWITPGNRDAYGAVNHNTADHALASWGYQWHANGINIQSGAIGGYYSSVAFTAPEAGNYTFEATFESMTDGKGTQVWVTLNDFSAPWNAVLDAFGGVNVIAIYTDTLSLNAGETVYFSNSPGNTMVDFQLTVTSCTGGYLPGDLNQDCYVNLEDFSLLAMDWLKCSDPLNVNCTSM
jgi:hypothetical protein